MKAMQADRKRQFTKRRVWTDEELEVLRGMFADTYTEMICSKLNRSYSSVCCQAYLMGLKKSEVFKKMELEKQGERLRVVGAAYRFKKDRIPENKGKRMPAEVYEKVKATMFKKGNSPHNAYADWAEFLRKDKLGNEYWMIKVPSEKKVKPKHVWLWEQQHGKVKRGYNVVFVDGNQKNCVLENLACVSDAELMERNSLHRFPVELKSTIRLLNKLKHKINEKQD
jgi:hypothetical protein